MDLKPKFQFEDKPAGQDEKLPKLRLEEIPAITQQPEINFNTAELTYLKAIADNTRSTKNWIRFIGILIIIGLVFQLLSSCLAG